MQRAARRTNDQFLAKPAQPTQSVATLWSDMENVKSYFFFIGALGYGSEKSDWDMSKSLTNLFKTPEH